MVMWMGRGEGAGGGGGAHNPIPQPAELKEVTLMRLSIVTGEVQCTQSGTPPADECYFKHCSVQLSDSLVTARARGSFISFITLHTEMEIAL